MATDKQITDLLVRCNYKYKDQTKRDIQSTLSYFKELNLLVDKYTYPNGQSKDLVTLNGTIPVTYKNSRYNIPVQLFLSDAHPYTPPLCYVRPTPEMSINVSDHVDANGRINLPVLREWNYPSSDIYMLLSVMAMKFSEQSPVFAKRQGSQQQQVYQPRQTPYPIVGRPEFPSYPSGGGYPSSATKTPYPVTNNPYYPMPQVGQTQPSYLSSNSGSSIGAVRTAGSNPPSTSYPSSTPYPLSTQQSFDTIKPEHIKMSIITAVTEKANNRYLELYSLKTAEVDSLKRVRDDLEMNQNQLNNYVAEIENEILNINNLTIELKEKTAQISDKISQTQHRDSADIEDAVVTPAPLYRQLMKLYAEESSIQDYIYYLGEGLQSRSISLEVFLKQVRFLTRKQFMLRATMQKARERAALPL